MTPFAVEAAVNIVTIGDAHHPSLTPNDAGRSRLNDSSEGGPERAALILRARPCQVLLGSTAPCRLALMRAIILCGVVGTLCWSGVSVPIGGSIFLVSTAVRRPCIDDENPSGPIW